MKEFLELIRFEIITIGILVRHVCIWLMINTIGRLSKKARIHYLDEARLNLYKLMHLIAGKENYRDEYNELLEITIGLTDWIRELS